MSLVWEFSRLYDDCGEFSRILFFRKKKMSISAPNGQKDKNTMSPKTFVFASGGCVVAVTDEHNTDLPEIAVIDWDNAENGQCPVCSNELDIDLDTCEVCGVHWDSGDAQEAINCYLSLPKE